MLPFDTASNEPTLSPTQPHPDAASPASLCAAPADPLPHVPMAAVKNEPIAPPDPILPAHAAQAGRNEPISASPTHRSQLPVARGSGESPSSTRRAGSFSDPLERLIRDAERRVAGLALAPSGVHSQALSHHRFR